MFLLQFYVSCSKPAESDLCLAWSELCWSIGGPIGGLTTSRGMPEPKEKTDQGRFSKRRPWSTASREEIMEGPGMQHWNKESRCKTAAMSGEGEEIQQDLQEDCSAGDRKANSQDFY
jgi:hypothetical protein